MRPGIGLLIFGVILALIGGVIAVRETPDTARASGHSVEMVDSSASAYTSLVLDANGFPVVSYTEGSPNYDLKLLHCGDADCASGNTIASLDTDGSVGTDTSVELDAAGNPVISYRGDTGLRVLHCGDATCTSGNTYSSPDTTGGSGRETSLELDANGYPVVSYRREVAVGDSDLKILHCGDATCTSGNSVTSPETAGSIGWWPSLGLDSNGFPVVSYYDDTNGHLKVLHCGDATCTAGNSMTSPDTSDTVGWFTSLKLDSSGFPVVSYYDDTNGYLKVLHCGDATCSSGNSITSADTSSYVGKYSSIQLDSSGFPVVSYYDSAYGGVKILHCGDANCTSGNSITKPVSGFVGRDGSLALDSSGNPVVSYIGSGLEILHCGDPYCSFKAVDTPTSTGTPTAADTPTQPPTDTLTATPSPTNTETPTPSPSATATETPTHTETPTNTETATPSPSGTPTAADTPTQPPTDTETPTPSPTNTETPTPTPSPTHTETPTPTATSTETSTPTPSVTPTATPTSVPGDVTGDGVVDVQDVIGIALLVGATPGDPGYDPAFDFNDNGRIDGRDLSFLIRLWLFG